MIYGVEAQSNIIAVPPIPYTATGVSFSSVNLRINSVACTNNEFFSFAGWIKCTSWPATGNLFYFDYTSNYYSGYYDGSDFLAGPDLDHYAGLTSIDEPPLIDNVWQHHIGCIDLNHAVGAKIRKLYIDDTDVAGNANYVDYTTGAASIAINGKRLDVGGISGSSYFNGAICDLSLWPGVSFLTASDISESTRRLFIDSTGKPVDPSVAIAALGSPVAFLTGGSDAFLSNTLGTAGAFTKIWGTMTDVAGPT